MATTNAEVWAEAMYHLCFAWNPAPGRRAWIFEPDVRPVRVLPQLPERRDSATEPAGICVLAIVNNNAIVMDTVTKAWTILHTEPA